MQTLQAPLGKIDKAMARLRRAARRRRLARLWFSAPPVQAPAPPHELFGGFDDELWLWANTAGYREEPLLRELLPAMPDEATQVRFTGQQGDATMASAFRFYALMRQLAARHGLRISECDALLDFGCGWGRVTRLFLRDLDPARIWGVDCLSGAIETSRRTNRWSNFQLIEPAPPTSFRDETFDLIYSYSVFSHLSEDAHLAWLAEFRRLLKPGGLLVATTRGREFIEFCGLLNQRQGLSHHLQRLAGAFRDTARWLSDYDAGLYCHHPLAGGEALESSFYGETCIPRGYVLAEWTKSFTFLDYLDDRAVEEQNVIVVRKGGSES